MDFRFSSLLGKAIGLSVLLSIIAGTTLSIITFLGGVQLFSIGIVGEYIGKIYLETKQRPTYIAEKIIESQQAKYCIRSVQQEPFNDVAEI